MTPLETRLTDAPLANVKLRDYDVSAALASGRNPISSCRSGFEVQWSDEAVRAYLDWLAIVTRDEIVLLWPQVEKVAHALVSSVAPLTWWRTTRRGSHAALGTVNHEAIRALGSLAATSPPAKAEPDGLEANGRAVAVVLPCSWRAEHRGTHGLPRRFFRLSGVPVRFSYFRAGVGMSASKAWRGGRSHNPIARKRSGHFL